MSGVTPLVDTLLATRLALRPDLVPLKGQVEIAGPGAVTHAEKVVNDIRLPSRAALEQQLGVALPGRKDGHPAAPRAGAEGAVTLSATARAIATLLGHSGGPALKIKGAEPLWAHGRAPLGQQLAAQLGQAVATSGLFYESHLEQHAAGLRSLAELVREPQAGLVLAQAKAAPAPASAEASLAARPGQAGTASISAQPPAVAASDSGAPPLSAVYGRAGTLEHGRPPRPGAAGQHAGTAALSTPGSGAGAPGNSHPVPAAIHPEAMALVRQQLELLTVPVFRWEGQAWPNAPMDWRIYEEPQGEGQSAADEGEAAPAAWTTRVAITLPSLKSMELRLTLAGASLQVHVTSEEDATLAVLDAGREALTGRFGTAGLQLTGLYFGAAAGGAARGALEDGHA